MPTALNPPQCDSKDDEEGGGIYQQKCIGFLQRTWGTILNDDDRNFACVAIYTVGWQCAHKMNATVVVSRWKLPDVRSPHWVVPVSASQMVQDVGGHILEEGRGWMWAICAGSNPCCDYKMCLE